MDSLNKYKFLSTLSVIGVGLFSWAIPTSAMFRNVLSSASKVVHQDHLQNQLLQPV